MLRRTIRLSVVCVILSSCVAAARADGIHLVNFKDEETVRYPVPFLQGTLDDKNARAITVINQSSKLPTKELKGVVHKGRFKALAELLPGPNKLLLRSGAKELTVTLHYKPQTNSYVVQVIYMTDRKGDTKYQTQKQNDPQNYRAKLDTVMKLQQSFTAERMNEPRFVEPPESQASYIAPLSGSSLKNSRWFALDDKPWKDGGAPRFTASGTEGDVLIESEHGLGYLGFDVKGDAVAHKTRGSGDRDPPRRYVLTAADLKELAGTTDVHIRAVDVQGQQAEAEPENLKGK